MLKSNKVILGVISAFIITIFTMSLNGIVGNRADAAFLHLLSFLRQSISINNELWIIALFFLMPLTLISVPTVLIAFHYYRSQQAAINIVKLDDSLLRILSEFKQDPNKQEAEARLFKDFLENTLELFTDGCRISILRPDQNLLSIKHALKIPLETTNRARFYIGSGSGQITGIAGQVFKNQSIQIAHLDWKNNQWLSDTKNYHDFNDSKNKRKSMSYRAMIAVPIIDTTNPSQSLGVLCLDSMDKKAFDSKQVQDGLQSIADRISAILPILKNYG